MSGPFVLPEGFASLSRLAQIELYTSSEYLIHPCSSPRDTQKHRGKRPLWTLERRLKASAKERLDEFRKNPEFNVGIVPVAPHIDLDVDVGDENFPVEQRNVLLDAFEKLHPNLYGETLRCRTFRGYHFLLYCADVPAGQGKLTIKNYLGPLNVEIFVGDGLNVIVPPSTHELGIVYAFQGVRELTVTWSGLLKALNYKNGQQSQERRSNGKNAGGEDTSWKGSFKGDLRSLDIVALCKELQIYGKELGEDSHRWTVHTVQCPWIEEHTDDEEWTEKDSSCAVLIKEGFIFRFNCFHTHGEGLTHKDFLQWAEEQKPGIVDRHCRGQFHRFGFANNGVEDIQEEPDEPIEYTRNPWPPSAAKPEDFEQKIFYPQNSILQHFMEYGRTQTEEDDAYLIGSILPVCAALVARRVWIDFGGPLYLNLFALIAGKPGDRKSFTIKIAKRIAQIILPSESFLPQSLSAEGLFNEYNEEDGGCPDKICIIDDAANLLSTWRTSCYGERVADQMLCLYDCEGLSEAFRRNKKEAAKTVKRRVPETSTSLIFGATFADALFSKQKSQQGLARRFNYYLSCEPERFIKWPKSAAISPIADLFKPLLFFSGRLSLAPEADGLWEEFQLGNRARIAEVPENRPDLSHALAGEPTHVLKIAALFELTIAAAKGVWTIHTIGLDALQLAIAHVAENLRAADYLFHRAKQLEAAQAGEEILAKIRTQFAASKKFPDTIFATRTQLTGAFCHNTSRKGAISTEELYLQILPELIRQGQAQLALKRGKFEVYAFRKTDEDDDSNMPGPKTGDNSTPPDLGRGDGTDFENSTNSAPPESTPKEENTSFSDIVVPEAKANFLISPNSTGLLSHNTLNAHNSFINSIYIEDTGVTSIKGLQSVDESGGGENGEKGKMENVQEAPMHECARDNGALFEQERLFDVKKVVLAEEPIIAEVSLSTADFIYCAGAEVAMEYFSELLANPISEPFALDIETYPTWEHPKAALYPHLGEIRLVSICTPGGAPIVFDLKRIGPCPGLDWAELFKEREVIVHNASFELKWFRAKFGFWLPRVFDTMHAARVLQNGVDGERNHTGLKTVLERYLGRTISKEEQLSDFGLEHLRACQIQYSGTDVLHLCDLQTELRRLLETAEGGSLLPIFALDMEYARVVAERELVGIRFDVDKARALLEEAQRTQALARSDLEKIFGPGVLLSSPAQVKEAFIKLGVDIPNTAEDTLSKVEHPAAARFLEYRKAETQIKELERILPHVHPDGRLYPDIDQLGTETARVVSTDPTINNLSVDTGMRECILPDHEDHVIIKSDFSREEPCIVASVFNVRALKADFSAGRDIYKGFAAQIFGVPLDRVIEEQLSVGKTNFLGVTYGQQWKRLVSAALNEGRTLSEETARKIVDAFDARYPEIRAAWNQARNGARNGRIRFGTSKLGRRRLHKPQRHEPTKKFAAQFLEPALIECFGSLKAASQIQKLALVQEPSIGKTPNAEVKNILKRERIQAARLIAQRWTEEVLPSLTPKLLEAWTQRESQRINWDAQQLEINFKIQAGGSDVLRKAEILFSEHKSSSARVILANHDEICVSAPREKALEVKALLERCMCEGFNAIYPDVPIKVESEILATWH
jgi:DNA polymerase I-like protein with 3'-5' exonuclease and polymerase domains